MDAMIYYFSFALHGKLFNRFAIAISFFNSKIIDRINQKHPKLKHTNFRLELKAQQYLERISLALSDLVLSNAAINNILSEFIRVLPIINQTIHTTHNKSQNNSK